MPQLVRQPLGADRLGEDKTIGDVDVYGNLETQQTPFSCMIAMLGSADYHGAVMKNEAADLSGTGMRPWVDTLWTSEWSSPDANTGVIVGVSNRPCDC